MKSETCPSKRTSGLIFAALLSGFLLINLAIAQELREKSRESAAAKKTKGLTRILISTSGPVKFNDYWLDDPPRLVVEFQSRNVLSKIDKELIINQGVIKRITSSYFGNKPQKSLKSLTFELFKKTPYRIWQKDNAIMLDIQAPLEADGFLVYGEEIVTTDKADEVVIKRLEAMDSTFLQLTENPAALEAYNSETQKKVERTEEKVILPEARPIIESQQLAETYNDKNSEQITQTQEKAISPVRRPIKTGKGISITNILLGVLAAILGTGLLGWRMRISSRERELENTKQGLKKLESELQEERKRFEQGEIIRKTIEETALKKEGEYEQLKSEFQEKDRLLKQEEIIRKGKEKGLLQKEREYGQLKDSYESLEGVLVKKGLVKKMLSRNGKESLWIPGQSAERRESPRIVLTRDYNRTVILKIDFPNKSESIKSFVNNISSEGLCFESRKEFTESEPINLRLFFYGDRIPIIKIQGQMVWKKKLGLRNYYGVFFERLDEKDKLKLDHYVDSKTEKHSAIEKKPEII